MSTYRSTTIHNFSTSSDHDVAALEAAQGFIENCERTSWTTVGLPSFDDGETHRDPTNVYEYRFVPPVWSFPEERWLADTLHTLKHWDEPIQDDEIFALDDLAEFTLLSTDTHYAPGAPYNINRAVSLIATFPENSFGMDIDQQSESIAPGLAGSLPVVRMDQVSGQRLLRDRSISMSFNTNPGAPYYPLEEHSDIASEPPSFIHHLAQSSQPNSAAEFRYADTTKERDEFGFSISSAKYLSFDKMDPYAEEYQLPRNNYLREPIRDRGPYSSTSSRMDHAYASQQSGETPESLHLRDVSLLYAQRDPSVVHEPIVLSPPSPKQTQERPLQSYNAFCTAEQNQIRVEFPIRGDIDSSDDSQLYGKPAVLSQRSPVEMNKRDENHPRQIYSASTDDSDLYGSTRQGASSRPSSGGNQPVEPEESLPPGLDFHKSSVSEDIVMAIEEDDAVPWPTTISVPREEAQAQSIATSIHTASQVTPVSSSLNISACSSEARSFARPPDQSTSSIDQSASFVSRDTDSIIISDLIPKPHYHPSPFAMAGGYPMPRIQPYTTRQPVPLSKNPEAVLPLSEYSRASWVIPIRGQTPWTTAGASRGEISALADASKEDSDTLSWTPTSLSMFWGLLLALHRSKECGPIGFMFHTAERVDKQNTSSDLRGVDYIKVYCEGDKVLYARQAIERNGYLRPNCRLVLIDEIGEGIVLL